MDRPLVSFLLPSRSGVGVARTSEALFQSLRSIVTTSSDYNAYEVLIRFDDDDEDSIKLTSKIHELFASTIAVVKIIIGPRYGYIGLHHYYNELAAISTGELLFLWNDDLEFLPVRSGWKRRNGPHEVEEWDMILKGEFERLEPHIFILYPTEVYWDIPIEWDESAIHDNDYRRARHISSLAFPILTRNAYEAMGHFSSSPLNDSYLTNVGVMCLDGKNIRKRSRIILHHYPDTDEIGQGWRADTPQYDEAYRIHCADEIREAEEKDQEALKALYEGGD